MFYNCKVSKNIYIDIGTLNTLLLLLLLLLLLYLGYLIPFAICVNVTAHHNDYLFFIF